MSNLVNWAEEELKRIGGQDDEMQQEMNKGILEMVKTFSEQGHSGFSSSYALSIIKKLLAWKPITPLTGEDDEWIEYADGMFQNKRSSEIFKDGKDGQPYWAFGKVFSDDGGETWVTSSESRVDIEFPYTIPEEPEFIILKEDK